LCRRHHLVDSVTASVRSVGIATRLDRLDFSQLLRRRLFRGKDIVDLLIACIRYI
jgi:hypothetical protein